jgi:hypothetical protein
MSRPAWPRTLASTALAGLLACAAARAQAPEPPRNPDEPPPRARVAATGFDAFRGLAQRAGLQPLKTWGELRADPRRNVLIVMGDVVQTGLNPEDLQAFLNDGGTVFVATDHPTWPVNDWLSSLRFFIPAGRVTTGNTAEMYRGLSDCPYVVPAVQDQVPIFHDLKKVATNRPGEVRAPGATVLARFGRSCVSAAPPDRFSRFLRADFAVYQPVGAGRLLVMSDHSVFINTMMMKDDNDNFTLAERTLEWLVGPEKRSGCLFYEDGFVRDSFDVAWIDPPPPSLKEIAEILKDNWPAAIPLMNAFARAAQAPDGPLRDLQGRDAPLNRWLNSLLPRSVLGQVLAVAAAVALILLGLSRATTARQRTDTEVAPAAEAPDPDEEDGTPLQRRLVAQAGRGDWYEVAREQVRERFRALGLLEADPDRPPTVGLLRGGWLRGRRLRRQVQELWRVGFGRAPEEVSAARWGELAARLDALEQSAVAGVWRFEPSREGG